MEEDDGGKSKKKSKEEQAAPKLPLMSPEEEDLIYRLHRLLGDQWLLISKRLPNRSAEDVENYWREKERRIYKQEKLFKPKCVRLSSSFKFPMEEKRS